MGNKKAALCRDQLGTVLKVIEDFFCVWKCFKCISHNLSPVKLMCEDFQQPLTLEKRERERGVKEREGGGGHLRVGGSPGRGYPAN